MLVTYFIYIPTLLLVFLLYFNMRFAQNEVQHKMEILTQLYSKTKILDRKKKLFKDFSNAYQNLVDWNKYFIFKQLQFTNANIKKFKYFKRYM